MPRSQNKVTDATSEGTLASRASGDKLHSPVLRHTYTICPQPPGEYGLSHFPIDMRHLPFASSAHMGPTKCGSRTIRKSCGLCSVSSGHSSQFSKQYAQQPLSLLDTLSIQRGDTVHKRIIQTLCGIMPLTLGI